MLMPADLEATPPAYEAAVKSSVRSSGGHIGPAGRVQMPDGGEVLFDGRDFRLTALSPGVCKVIFDAALRTNTYISNGGAGSDLVPLKVKGSTVKPPPEFGPAVLISNPGALCGKLRGRLTQWNRELGRLQAEGVISPDGEPLEPPPSPGTEPRLTSDPSGLAAKCEAQSRKIAGQLGWRFVRSVVTQSEKWGVVWRADIAPEADEATWFRDSCWRAPHAKIDGPISFSARPLQMFDASKSIPPLATE